MDFGSCSVLKKFLSCLATFHVYLLWFKFILGLKFFALVSILFNTVPDYGNEYRKKENIN